MDTKNQVLQMVAKYFSLETSALRLESKIVRDLGADSLDVVELVMLSERDFGVSISDEALAQIKTVADLAETIEQLGPRPFEL